MGWRINKLSGIEVGIAAILVATALLLQSLTGDFPVDIFTFPLNVIVMVLWLLLVGYLYNNRSNYTWVKSLLSMRATLLSLGVMVATGIYLGLQREPNATAWPIVIGILFTLTHLLFITMRGWRTSGGVRWRFTLLHMGLILVLGAGFWGAPDRVQLRAILSKEHPAEVAYHTNGTATRLDHAIALHDLNAQYNEEGMPMHFDATIEVDNKEVTLRVNHPYNRTIGEKIYLVSIDSQSSYCIVEIVREPWQWVSLAGIALLLMGAVMLFIRGPRQAANRQHR